MIINYQDPPDPVFLICGKPRDLIRRINSAGFFYHKDFEPFEERGLFRGFNPPKTKFIKISVRAWPCY